MEDKISKAEMDEPSEKYIFRGKTTKSFFRHRLIGVRRKNAKCKNVVERRANPSPLMTKKPPFLSIGTEQVTNAEKYSEF